MRRSSRLSTKAKQKYGKKTETESENESKSRREYLHKIDNQTSYPVSSTPVNIKSVNSEKKGICITNDSKVSKEIITEKTSVHKSPVKKDKKSSKFTCAGCLLEDPLL